jgi:hypothetical protein
VERKTGFGLTIKVLPQWQGASTLMAQLIFFVSIRQSGKLKRRVSARFWVASPRCFLAFLMAIGVPKSRHRKGFQAAALAAGVRFQRIDAHRHRLHTEGSPPCFPYVPVSYEKHPRGNKKASQSLPASENFFSHSRA